MSGHIIFVIGITGAGKTQVGKLIAQKLNCALIDLDAVSTSFTNVLLQEHSPIKNVDDRESDYFVQQVRPLQYDTLLTVALENAKLGQRLVITGDFSEEIQQQHWLETHPIAQQLQAAARISVVQVHVDHQTLLNRLVARNAPKDRWKLANWDQYVASVKNMKVLWDPQRYDITTFDNSDCLPVLYEMKVNTLLQQLR